MIKTAGKVWKPWELHLFKKSDILKEEVEKVGFDSNAKLERYMKSLFSRVWQYWF